MEQNRKDVEFLEWIKEMQRKYYISFIQLEKGTGIERHRISEVINGKKVLTNKFKYLMVVFFEEEYGEIYEFDEDIRPKTFSDWLHLVTKKYKIADDVIAEELKVGKSSITCMRKGETYLGLEDRKKILDFLQRKFGVDISYGKELLNCIKRKSYMDMGNWLREEMESNRIMDYEIERRVGISQSAISSIRSGRIAPAPKTAEKIFGFFDRKGIDTTDGRKIYEIICKEEKDNDLWI